MLWKSAYFAPFALVAGCSLGGSMPAEYPDAVHRLDAPSQTVAQPGAAPTRAQDEQTVTKEASLEAISRLAVANSPTVREARARARAALARVSASGRLPDLEFKYELWGQPLEHPLSFGMAGMHMFGLRQTFPAAGSLDAQSRIAMEQANVELELVRTRELDVLADVKKAWSSYWSATRERAVHGEHAELTTRLVTLARVQLQVGKTSPADVLRMQLELSRIHADMIALDQQLSVSRARLNLLMGRDLDAPLGPPPEPKSAVAAPKIEQLRAMLLAKRPEIAAANGAIQKDAAAVDVAKSEAKWPTVMVGADYQLMPGTAMPHNYGAMVQFSLPWLNTRHREEVKAAEAVVSADREALAALVDSLVLQVREALARYDGARASLALLDADVLPIAKQTFETAQATYAGGGGDSLSVVDSLRSYLQVRVDRSRALANVEIALADLERAVGGPLPTKDATTGKEVAP